MNRIFTRNNSNKNSKSMSLSGRRSALPKSMERSFRPAIRSWTQPSVAKLMDPHWIVELVRSSIDTPCKYHTPLLHGEILDQRFHRDYRLYDISPIHDLFQFLLDSFTQVSSSIGCFWTSSPVISFSKWSRTPSLKYHLIKSMYLRTKQPSAPHTLNIITNRLWIIHTRWFNVNRRRLPQSNSPHLSKNSG